MVFNTRDGVRQNLCHFNKTSEKVVLTRNARNTLSTNAANSYLPGAATEVESVPLTLELGAKDKRNNC